MNAYDENVQYLIKILRGPAALKKSHEYALNLMKEQVAKMEASERVDPVILKRITSTEHDNIELQEFVERTKDLRAELIQAFREANLND